MRKAFSETNRNLSYTISTREAKLNKERTRLSPRHPTHTSQIAAQYGISESWFYKQ